MIDWRLSMAWLTLASLGSISAAGLGGATAPLVAVAHRDATPVAGMVNDVAAYGARRPVIVAHRDADGLFYATLTVNDQPVRFLIDTGATHMVLRESDVQGIARIEGQDLPTRLSTAGGTRAAHWARLEDVVIDQVRVGTVNAIVTETDLPASLLGQDVLERLGPLHIDGDKLTVGGDAAAR